MKQSLIKRIKNNQNRAVSEVVGTILLLGISVTLFSVIYAMVLGIPYSPPTPTVNIVYSLNDNNLTLTNLGGKTLGLDTKIKILINDTLYKTYNLTTSWGIGQELIFDLSEYINDIDYSVEVLVIDSSSNSIVMMGKTSIKNRPPIISLQEPYNKESNVTITLTKLNISISDADNDAFRWTIETIPNIGSNSGLMQVYIQNIFNCAVSGLAEDTDYIWYVNTTDINGKSTNKTYTFTTGIIEPSEEEEHKDAIDNNSTDVDSSTDKGTETNFTKCKTNATDTEIMTIKEYKPPIYTTKDNVDDNTCNKGSPSDIGTESDFDNSKDINPDSDVMILTEANQGGSATKTIMFKSAGAGTAGTGTSFNVPYPSSISAGNLLLLQAWVGDLSGGAVNTPVNWQILSGPNPTASNDGGRQWVYYKFATGSESGNLAVTTQSSSQAKAFRMYQFTNVSTSSFYGGIGFDTTTSSTISDRTVTTPENNYMALNFIAIGEDGGTCSNFAGESGGDWTQVISSYDSSSGTDMELQVQVDVLETAGTINGGSYNYGQSDPYGIIGFYLKPEVLVDYELDFEYQFNNTNFNSDNKQLCFYLTIPPTETLIISYWNGGWINLGNITHSGWTNLTANGLTNSTYNIRIIDQNQTSDSTQNTWNIDCMFLHTWNNTDYQMDFEYQFTQVYFRHPYETLCIYVTSHSGSETLNINYWDGNSWESLGIITGTGWINITATGLTSPTYTIQLKGATEISDTEQDEWNIDCIYLYTRND